MTTETYVEKSQSIGVIKDFMATCLPMGIVVDKLIPNSKIVDDETVMTRGDRKNDRRKKKMFYLSKLFEMPTPDKNEKDVESRAFSRDEVMKILISENLIKEKDNNFQFHFFLHIAVSIERYHWWFTEETDKDGNIFYRFHREFKDCGGW